MKEIVRSEEPRSGTGSSHPEFLRGYEAGRITARIELLGHLTLRETISRDNEDVVREIAKTAGRPYQATGGIDDERIAVTIEPVRSAIMRWHPLVRRVTRTEEARTISADDAGKPVDSQLAGRLAAPSAARYKLLSLSFFRSGAWGGPRLDLPEVEKVADPNIAGVGRKEVLSDAADGNGSTGQSGPGETTADTERAARSLGLLLKGALVFPARLATSIRPRLERRYTELVPRHIRELAEANGLPIPNRYVPAGEAEPIIYAEDVWLYAGLESFYSERAANGNGQRGGRSDAGKGRSDAGKASSVGEAPSQT